MAGALFLVATPIGNLEDITFRARRILQEADAIFAEDTRRTRALLAALEIPAPQLLRADEAALARGAPQRHAVRLLQEGKNVVLVSDAGTPGIADPGWRLVAAVCEALPSVRIVSVPGPSALTAALAAAHFPVERFVFFGYPPRKKGRERFLRDVASEKRAAVLFESTHRMGKTLETLASFAPSRPALWARELTKMHEALLRGSLAELARRAKEEPVLLRGEHVVVLAPRSFCEEDEQTASVAY